MAAPVASGRRSTILATDAPRLLPASAMAA